MATAKQIAAVKKIAENHGNISKSMREVGYSPQTAKKPSNLTESKGFNELLEQYFPDDYVFDKHQKILDYNEGDPKATQAVKLVYELKGKLKQNLDVTSKGEKIQGLIQIN